MILKADVMKTAPTPRWFTRKDADPVQQKSAKSSKLVKNNLSNQEQHLV
jgi:hypothetical protein